MKFFPLKIISIHLNYFSFKLFQNQARSRSAQPWSIWPRLRPPKPSSTLLSYMAGIGPIKYGLMGYTRAPCARAAWQRAASFIPLWTRTAR